MRDAEAKFKVSRIETKTNACHQLEIDKKNALRKKPKRMSFFRCRKKIPDFPKDLRLNQILGNRTNVSFAQNEKNSVFCLGKLFVFIVNVI